MRKHLHRFSVTVIAVVAAALTFGAATSSAALPVVYNSALSAVPGVLSWGGSPAGSNDWNCKPSSKHPNPVVLVHGTFANMGVNWGTLSPLLKNEGYCVFALNYGAVPAGLGFSYGLGSLEASAGELSTFVDKVRAATGKSKVDIVGHSQGGMLPNYYIKFLGGAPKVNALVGLAPDNHGSDVSNLLKLANQISKLLPKISDVIYSAIGTIAPGLSDQKFDSPLIKKLNSVPDTVAGIKYTVISTKYDGIATPVKSQALSGNGAKQIYVQDKCWLDVTDHIGIAFDHVALREVLNALDPANSKKASCYPVLPLLGG